MIMRSKDRLPLGCPVISRVLFRSSINSEGCWEICDSFLDSKGYGRFTVDGKNVAAHRISYTELVDEIPYGFNVLHWCDNPSCINPEHLFLGTQEDNMKDMVNKGRNNNPVGEEAKSVKLKEVDIHYIRNSDRSNNRLSDELGVTAKHISGIRRRTCWKHIE